MSDAVPLPEPFAWLATGHPFRRVVDGLAEAVARDAEAGRLAATATSAGGQPQPPALRIHAEIKAQRQDRPDTIGPLDGALGAPAAWSLVRAYWSLQCTDQDAALGLRTRSLVWHGTPHAGRAGEEAPHLDEAARPVPGWRPDHGHVAWHTLPDDPRLPGIAQWLAARQAGMAAGTARTRPATAASLGVPANGGTLQVLRYVPLRRLTFAWQQGDQRRIGKFRRRSRHAGAFALMGSVAEAVRRHPPGFAVAQPLHAEPATALYFQSALPGVDLADLIAPRADGGGGDEGGLWAAEAALAHLGRLTAALHALPLPGTALPLREDPVRQAQTTLEQLHLLHLLMPGLAAEWRALGAAVLDLPDALPADGLRFCHGDLVCSQCLVAGVARPDHSAAAASLTFAEAAWSVTDFDLAHVGDPCRDLAQLVASLDDDLPALAQLARRHPAVAAERHQNLAQTFLEAYARHGGGALPADRLRWHQLCAEVHQLWLMLTKDRYHPLVFIARIQRALGHADAPR